LPFSKQNMHNKLFKQDLSYFSKKISVRQKALITFLCYIGETSAAALPLTEILHWVYIL